MDGIATISAGDQEMSELYKPSSAAGGLSLPSAALERSRALADPGGRAALLRAAFPATRSRGDDADICAHLFRLCSALQADHLDAHGIACLFDVEPGRLPRPGCDTPDLIVTALTLA